MANGALTGVRVTVVMARNNIFPWQSGPSFEGIYEGGPCGAGDTIRVLLDDRTRVELNGNSPEFVAMYCTDTGKPF